jgi:prepilin-type N-terminal cleavage/methylation domain-containing protein
MKPDYTNITLSKENRGFSLIEVMIAMAIFSIGILAIASMQLSSTKNNTTGNITTQASMLARQKIEELKGQDIADLTPVDEQPDPNNPIDVNGDSGPKGAYNRYWTIETIPDSNTSRKITVYVDWKEKVDEGQSRNRRAKLETITRGNGQ